MKRLRVLLLTHPDQISPVQAEGYSEREMQAWRYDPPGIEELTAWAIAQVGYRTSDAA